MFFDLSIHHPPHIFLQGHRALCRVDREAHAVFQHEQFYFVHPSYVVSRRAPCRTCRKIRNDWRDTRAPGHNKGESENTLHTIQGGESPVEARDYEMRVNSENGSETGVEVVFFAGAHYYTLRSTHVQRPAFVAALSDVGGGSVKNTERHSLARIPLRWMIIDHGTFQDWN